MNVNLPGIGLYRIRPGDQVTFSTPQGQQRRGRVVFSFDSHVTLNCGGKHGTPAVVTERNFVKVAQRRTQPATAGH